MRIPDCLVSLADQGILSEVVRPLMSGKEAEVFLVVSSGELRVAKVYKEAQNRSFKNRAEYTEGRKVRNSRDQRAIEKRSRHGRAKDEAAWRSTEVDMIYRLRDAGVRVPTPHHFVDGVLMYLVQLLRVLLGRQPPWQREMSPFCPSVSLDLSPAPAARLFWPRRPTMVETLSVPPMVVVALIGLGLRVPMELDVVVVVAVVRCRGWVRGMPLLRTLSLMILIMMMMVLIPVAAVELLMR